MCIYTSRVATTGAELGTCDAVLTEDHIVILDLWATGDLSNADLAFIGPTLGMR